MEELIFYGLLFVVALLYASVGHGGASGYLALMAIFGMSVDTMKSSALILNLFVSLVAFIQFYKGGHFNFRSFLPFALYTVHLPPRPVRAATSNNAPKPSAARLAWART